MADHHHRLGPGTVVGRVEQTPELGAGAEEGEEVAAHQQPPGERRLLATAGRDTDRGADVREGDEIAHGALPVLEIEEVEIGDGELRLLAAADRQPHGTPGVRRGEPRPEDRRQVGEERRGGADPQRQRHDHRQGEPRLAGERAQGGAQGAGGFAHGFSGQLAEAPPAADAGDAGGAEDLDLHGALAAGVGGGRHHVEQARALGLDGAGDLAVAEGVRGGTRVVGAGGEVGHRLGHRGVREAGEDHRLGVLAHDPHPQLERGGEQAEGDREEEDDEQRRQQRVPRLAALAGGSPLHQLSPRPPPRGRKYIVLWVSCWGIAPRSTGIPGRGERGTARRL